VSGGSLAAHLSGGALEEAVLEQLEAKRKQVFEL
jgi:hypothetical protein